MKRYSRIYIEITNVCNLSCSFCIGNSRPARFMSVDEFSHILEQAKPFTDHVYLHVLGEPLLHPQLVDILAVSHRFGMNVNITTNGTLLAKTQDVLLNSPTLRKVSVSLHSLEHSSENSKEIYLQNVATFAQNATAKGVICDLRIWNLGADNTDNEAIFAPLCRFLGLDDDTQQAALAKINEVGNTMLAPLLFLGKSTRFLWPSMSEPRTEEPIFCHGLRNQVAVLCDGTVVPCCLDSKGDIALGNIFKSSLAQILSGERAQALYNGFSARKPTEELCHRCGYARRF